MKYPILICRRNTLVLGSEDFFGGIGLVDVAGKILEIGVARGGSAFMKWILDADGALFKLKCVGPKEPNVLQRLRLKRRRELYDMLGPLQVHVSELKMMVQDLVDENAEAPNAADLRDLLEPMPDSAPVDRELLRGYFGE